MARWLVLASVLWPALAAVTVWQRASHPPAAWTTAIYLAASRICHQRAERSFHTAGVQWPVCGRCSGLYLGAAIAGLVASATRRRPRPRLGIVAGLVVAAAPTLATVVLEWSGMPMTNVVRALAAVPLGFAIAVVVTGAASGGPQNAIR